MNANISTSMNDPASTNSVTKYCPRRWFDIQFLATLKPRQTLTSRSQLLGAMAGHGNDEPNQYDYVDVVNIGADDDDSEVTIFYRPHKGLNFHCP